MDHNFFFDTSDQKFSQQQTPIGRAQIPDRDQNRVDNHPNANAAKTKQFSDAFLPKAQIKSIHAKAAQRDAQNQRRKIFRASRPVAF